MKIEHLFQRYAGLKKKKNIAMLLFEFLTGVTLLVANLATKTSISSNFSHKMMAIALVLREFTTCNSSIETRLPGSVTCIAYKFGHQVAPLAFS